MIWKEKSLTCKYTITTYEKLPLNGVNFPTIQNDMYA